VIGGENGDGKLKRVELYNWQTSGANFINVKRAHFLYKCLFSSYASDWAKNLHKKCARKMLMKLMAGVNFTNILLTAFTLIAPESIKKIDNLTVIFTLLGSASVKDVHRT
jgi:hypothetical protein